MPRWAKRTALGGAATGIAGAGAIMAAPLLLDRIYYRGPPSDHFDGERFFNPDDARSGTPRRRFSLLRFARFAMRRESVPWPEGVPVTQSHPPERVAGSAMRVTWIGHSTVLIQTARLNILTDPIWSERASPFSALGPKRVREPGVAFSALPRIDIVLLSHSHYDHLDLATLERLWARDRPRIVVPLGTDTILRDAGIPSIAGDWGDRIALAPDVEVRLARVHHWTSRWGADRNRSLWTGYDLRLPGGAVFFAGDTGWGDGSWAREAARAGPYRLAIIPIGAFEPRAMMGASHVDPDEAATIFRRLDAAYGLAVHWGTFRLSAEAIDAPPERLAAALARDSVASGRFRALQPGDAWDVPQR